MSDDHPSRSVRSRRERRHGHGWIVTLDFAGSRDQSLADGAGELCCLLEPFAGDVMVDEDLSRYGATFSIAEPDLDAASALAYGSKIFRDLAARAGLPRWPIVHAEVTHVTDQPTLRIVH
jgi:hypothetical protein